MYNLDRCHVFLGWNDENRGEKWNATDVSEAIRADIACPVSLYQESSKSKGVYSDKYYCQYLWFGLGGYTGRT